MRKSWDSTCIALSKCTCFCPYIVNSLLTFLEPNRASLANEQGVLSGKPHGLVTDPAEMPS